MLLKIEESLTINQINADLHQKFPYLKLVFFNKKNHNRANETKARVTELDKQLGLLFPAMRNAHINVSGNMQARTLEQKIEDLTGITVQIFRRSGKSWLETLTTDNKTLCELSKMAVESLEDQNLNEAIDLYEQE